MKDKLDALLIKSEFCTIPDFLRMIEQEKTQRLLVWNDDKQSKLIESVLMRIPIPAFYLAENENGHRTVIDGLQRWSTFQRFITNKLQLKLPDQMELNGKRFNDLVPKFQNRIEDFYLVLYIIDAKSSEQARLDIFERVNSGLSVKSH